MKRIIATSWSNGKAQATLKSTKGIIATFWSTRTLNEDKLCHAVLQYRNTSSRQDGLSPAQKFYGRPIQDTLPAHRCSFALEWQRSAQLAKQQAAKTLQRPESYSGPAESVWLLRFGPDQFFSR